jgi:outer membrane murein-binding lipoprotein Lpp
MNRLITAVCVVLAAGCSSTQPKEPLADSNQSEDRDLAALVDLIAPDRERPEVDLAKIESHPLGTKENPVRVSGPAGEHAYLGRLRCKDGAAPAFKRLGSSDVGPFGYIMDIYDVSCPAASSTNVFMDMYHSKHREDRAIPGFEIEPDGA